MLINIWRSLKREWKKNIMYDPKPVFILTYKKTLNINSALASDLLSHFYFIHPDTSWTV